MDKNQISNLIKIILISIALFSITVMLIKRFIYFQPSSKLFPTSESYEDIKQGELHGRIFSGTDPDKPIIVFCHGNAGNLTTRNDKIAPLCKMGYSVLIFDYSGYGKSQGVPNEQQCYDDASVFIALLRQTKNPEEIVLYGESMGAPIAVFAARRYGIPTVIVESSLISIKNIIKTKFKFLSFLSFLFPEFNMKSFLKGFQGRVLMLHSPSDEIIPFSNAEKVREMVTKFLPIRGDHNNPIIPWEEVDKFITQKE